MWMETAHHLDKIDCIGQLLVRADLVELIIRNYIGIVEGWIREVNDNI